MLGAERSLMLEDRGGANALTNFERWLCSKINSSISLKDLPMVWVSIAKKGSVDKSHFVWFVAGDTPFQ